MAFALVDHRLDGKNHARFEDETLAFAAVVDYLRRFVETAADAVSAEFLYYGVAGIFGNLLAGIADVAAGGARRRAAEPPAVTALPAKAGRAAKRS